MTAQPLKSSFEVYSRGTLIARFGPESFVYGCDVILKSMMSQLIYESIPFELTLSDAGLTLNLSKDPNDAKVFIGSVLSTFQRPRHPWGDYDLSLGD